MNLKKNRWSLPAFAVLASVLFIMALSAFDHHQASTLASHSQPQLQVATQP